MAELSQEELERRLNTPDKMAGTPVKETVRMAVHVGDSDEMAAATIARRHREVGRLYTQGYTQQEIAEKLGVHAGTISRDIAVIMADWIRSTSKCAEVMVARQVNALLEAHREYWEAWHQSKGLHTKTTVETRAGRRKTKGAAAGERASFDARGESDADSVRASNDARGDTDEQGAEGSVKRETEELCGDPRYLAGVERVWERLSKLLGLDAAREVNLNVAPVTKYVAGIDESKI